ncbi:MAG TPA: hypothetical protein VEA99_21555 [Gemmatimonadaceae bacterium]|nr:hypothetical protein [Gemmatimonadaceae bacterium]
MHSLAHGAPSAEAALRAVVRAASTHDTAMLVRLAVTRAEWGRLYYPTSRFARPPYRSPAALQWGLTVAASDKGVRRLLRELGGRDVTVRDVRCGPPRDEGANQLWLGCEVTYRVGARDATRSITGALIARDGRVKVLSYANDF